MKSITTTCLVLCACFVLSCSDRGLEVARTSGIESDEDLVTLITQTDPLASYTIFPDADTIAAGTLNGSDAHRPLVRVWMNSTASAALSSGRLPVQGGFPDGAVIVKEILMDGRVTLLAVMVKDRSNPLAGRGWLWAEIRPDGTPYYSVRNRGEGCAGCHVGGEGVLHDLVRTFERQRP